MSCPHDINVFRSCKYYEPCTINQMWINEAYKNLKTLLHCKKNGQIGVKGQRWQTPTYRLHRLSSKVTPPPYKGYENYNRSGKIHWHAEIYKQYRNMMIGK